VALAVSAVALDQRVPRPGLAPPRFDSTKGFAHPLTLLDGDLAYLNCQCA